jgi:hypothetical protein
MTRGFLSRKFLVVIGAFAINTLAYLKIIPQDPTTSYVGYINGISALYVAIEGMLDMVKKPKTDK